MSEEIINEQPQEQQNTVEPETSSVPPASQPTSSVTGLASSVLKTQTEAERKKIEREIEKHRAVQEGQKKPVSPILIMLLALVVFIVGIGLFKPEILKKIMTRSSKLVAVKKVQPQPIILSYDMKVSGTNGKFTVLASTKTDKVTGIFTRTGTGRSITKSGLKKQALGKGMLWEVPLTQLRKGDYTYKVFVRDPQYPDVGLVTGIFVVK